MAKCQAGDCEIECANPGCGCIAESDNPEICSCFCANPDPKGGVKFDPGTLVDVSVNELPLFDAANFFNTMSRETIMVPAHRGREQLNLSMKRQPFGEVLKRLDLKTKEQMEREERILAALMLFGGIAVGALLSRLVSQD